MGKAKKKLSNFFKKVTKLFFYIRSKIQMFQCDLELNKSH